MFQSLVMTSRNVEVSLWRIEGVHCTWGPLVLGGESERKRFAGVVTENSTRVCTRHRSPTYGII